MRPLTAVLIVSAALALSASASAQPPTYEVRTFTDSNLTPFDPAAPAATTENTLKEPWLCPLCSYSTGGTWDTSGAGAPAWDANSNGIPDEAENAGAPGDCPDPWNVHGGATVPLVQAGVAERFMAYRWLGPALTLIRGLPFRPGDVDPAVAGGATNAISRVRAAFAFDPGNAGLPGFDLGGQPTQVRFLLIPPGVARPTARYRSLQWEPRAGTPGNPIPPGADPRELWGADPEPWIRNGDIRIGVHPWRAVDGDVYQVRCRVRQGAGPSVDVQVWSDANGLEYDGRFDPAVGLIAGVCASGAVRLDIGPGLMTYPGGGPPPPRYWWAFQFRIANNCRTIPSIDNFPGASTPNWLTAPDTPPNFGGGGLTDPENYFEAQALPGSGGSRGAALDTFQLGSSATTLSDATAVDFRLRPGETGTGMVAAIWRNDRRDMWSYDEDTAPSPQAGNPEPAHVNGVQPVAARFFGSRIDTGNPVLDIPAGAPGGATDVASAGGGADLLVTNRQVGEIVRCPLHVPNVVSRQSGDPTHLYIDPWWAGGTISVNGSVVGLGPGGDTPLNAAGNPITHAGNPASPTRTVGCGAVHAIDASADCWCGRRHNPAVSDSLYCNYCGTRLLGVGAAPDDLERAAARVDIAAPQAVTSRPGALDARRADGVYSLPADAVRGTTDGVMAPGATYLAAGSTLRTVPNPLFASLPAFTAPSYDPGPAGAFENGPAQPYQGAYVAYRTADEDRVWYEDPLTGAHDRWAGLAAGLPKQRVCDGDGHWNAFHRCPDCGNKHPGMVLAAGTGADPYVYTDQWTAGAWTTELECSYGRVVGAVAPNAGADECPGHQLCPACGAEWEVQGEGQGPELALMTLTVCPFDGVALVSADTLQTRMTPDGLTAEEFDPLVVQANVTRRTRLAADAPTVNLGRVSREWNLGVGPAEMTPIANVGAESVGNYTVGGPTLLTQGLTCANMAGADSRSMTTAAVENPVLVRMDADPTPEHTSPHRAARALPITRERLFAGVASAFPAAGNWGGTFAAGSPGGAGGNAGDALMRGGTVLALPLPIGEGSGNYSGSALAFVDTDANGALSFLDRSAGLAATNSLATPFDATEDYPLEPVIPLNLRLRVAESRMPSNDANASDASPAPLFTDVDTNGLHDRLNVIWESDRPAATPNNAVNLYEASTTVAAGPGLARDYIWNDDGGGNPWVNPITADGLVGTVNGSPEVYLNPGNTTRWLLWHKLTPTNVGVASTLWSASAPADMSLSFNTAGTANYVFDSSLDKSWIRGFVNVNATAPNNHWSFWNSGKRGREEIHYCYGVLQAGQTPQTSGYNPQDPNTVADEILPLSNGVAPSAKRDWVPYGATYIRKPPKSPFTYAKDPAPIMEADPLTGEWMLRVFFTGFVPQEGNSDICYARFRVSDLANPDANYGKATLFAVSGATGGEELRADGPRQTFGSQHLDWITTRRRPNEPGDADFMRAVSPTLDPQFFIHLVSAGGARDVYRVTWAQETAPTDRLPHRYDRAEGVYRLSGLTLWRIAGSSFAASYTPVEPRTGRDLELSVDPAAGLVRFSVPLFNPTDPADPSTFFNSGSFGGVVDAQLWANYTPFIGRVCRNDANDDSPSAFFDYGDPNLASPMATPAERVSLGHTVVFWRRSHGASEPPHFGRTSFMYRTYCNAVQVAHPPIQTLTSVTDVTLGAAVAPIGTDTAAGIIGLPWGTVNPGDRIRVEYDSASAGSGFVEYHIAPGWGQERRVNVDTVYAEGPLLAKREWYAFTATDANNAAATQYLARYWLFWTSPRGHYYYDSGTGTGQLYQSRDVYYATVVPEYGTSTPVLSLPSR